MYNIMTVNALLRQRNTCILSFREDSVLTAYFDNSATTKPCAEAAQAASFAIGECWGNPSSLHFAGTAANDLLKKSRKQVAALLKCPENDFYFTSSGTLANSTAVFGAYERLKKEGNRIVTTALEHPSILEPLKRLEKNGVEVIRIAPDKNGKINRDELLSAINADTLLVSCMAVNNEVGTVMPVDAIRAAVRRAGAPALIHTDCVQAFGKINITPASTGADLITVSAHKIHGLKGAGGIYIKDKNKIKPYILGGGQEKGVFSGTEAMPAIAAFGAAAGALYGKIDSNFEYVAKLKKMFTDSVGNIECIRINSPDDSVPYIINISVLGLPSQPTVNFLSEKGICISAGSACKLGHRSPVLTAMGLEPEIIDSAVRISFSRFNTEDEVAALAAAVREAAEKYGKK